MDTARNELERLVAQLLAGELEPEEFGARILREQVFVPVRDEKHGIAGFQTSVRAQPLLAEDEDGQRALIVFTDPDRSRAFLSQHPGYGGGMITEFSWILRRVGEGIGISLNPGEAIGLDFDTEMVALLASLLPDETC